VAADAELAVALGAASDAGSEQSPERRQTRQSRRPPRFVRATCTSCCILPDVLLRFALHLLLYCTIISMLSQYAVASFTHLKTRSVAMQASRSSGARCTQPGRARRKSRSRRRGAGCFRARRWHRRLRLRAGCQAASHGRGDGPGQQGSACRRRGDCRQEQRRRRWRQTPAGGGC